jgi:transcriptional regulator
MLRIKQILQLLDDGLSQNKICAEVKCSKRLVSSVKKRTDESGKAIGELLMLPDDEGAPGLTGIKCRANK